LISAAWTDLHADDQLPSATPDRQTATLASLPQLLHARTIVDALLSRLRACHEAPKQEECQRATTELTGDVAASKPHRAAVWTTLNDEQRALVLLVLARLMARLIAAQRNAAIATRKDKNHE
jgi:hypothetical protein